MVRSYFRAHHDSGRLLTINADGEANSTSSSSDSDTEDHTDGDDNAPRGGHDGSMVVELDRDQFGAARVATVFVYLSSHAGDEGGATRFSHLSHESSSPSSSAAASDRRGSSSSSSGGGGGGGSSETTRAVRVAPVAGAAACWSNVCADGRADPCMVSLLSPRRHSTRSCASAL